VLTASKELEQGFRAMLLHAEGLFRLDVTLHGDTLRTVVRNLSPGQLEMQRGTGYPGAGIAFGDIERYQPSQARVGFSLGEGDDRVDVEAIIGTLRLADRGTIKVSAQAIVRGGPSS
jgi:hypothetical protein